MSNRKSEMESDPLIIHNGIRPKFMKIFRSSKIAPAFEEKTKTSIKTKKKEGKSKQKFHKTIDESLKTKLTAHCSKTKQSEEDSKSTSNSSNPPYIESTPYCYINEEAVKNLYTDDPQAQEGLLDNLSIAAIECQQSNS